MRLKSWLPREQEGLVANQNRICFKLLLGFGAEALVAGKVQEGYHLTPRL